MNYDDLDAFDLPPPTFNHTAGNIQVHLKEESSPLASGLPTSNNTTSLSGPPNSDSSQGNMPPPPPLRPISLVHSLPNRGGGICRRIHHVLLSPTSKRRTKFDVEGLLSIWDELEISWNDLGALLDRGSPVDEKEIDLKRFVAGWKCFLFECRKFQFSWLLSGVLCENLPLYED